jgi:hypothetical protein
VWKTNHYARADFGGLKPGMGVWLDLGEPRHVASVEVNFAVPGASGELRGGDTDPGTNSAGDQSVIDTYKRIGDPKADIQSTALFGGADQPFRYLLVWITKLPADPATDSANRYQVSISEITVRVQ